MELFEEAKAINQVVDLDFSNFDIDDNCYVYHINNGKRVVLSEFKTELKLQNAEAPPRRTKRHAETRGSTQAFRSGGL